MKELLLKHIIEIIFCCITGVFTFYLQKLKYELQQYKYIQSSLKALLRDRLFQGCKYFIKQGYINFEEYENLTDLYNEYINLGGNGTAKAIYEKLKNLEIKQVNF
jgi:hypothetical protein